MNFHKTPQHIVKLIKKHVPKNAVRVLEPAVGEGALLEALSPLHFNEHLTLVDVDIRRLKTLEISYRNLSFVNANFLTWADRGNKERYDLVITNPPFSAKSKEWVWYDNTRVPIEIAFVKRAVGLLQDKGTLIAIVPDSFVNSYKFSEEREWMLSQGKIRYVYQLPRKSFTGIEGAFFLLVFKKGERGGVIRLRRFSAGEILEIKIDKEILRPQGYRLDYSYYCEKFCYDKATGGFEEAACFTLGAFCEIKRGPIRNNYKSENVTHSNSYRSGYWENYIASFPKNNELCVAVKRVSRDAHLSFGLFCTEDISNSTDCVITIQAKNKCPMELLFFLRVLFSNQSGGELLLKGVGAKFIPIEALKNIKYFDLSDLFGYEYSLYVSAYKSMRYDLARKIESEVYLKIHNTRLVSSIQLRMIESELEGLVKDGVGSINSSAI